MRRHFPNTAVKRRLEKISRFAPKAPPVDRVEPLSETERQGVVTKTVIDVLVEAGQPAGVKAIHPAVEHRLGHAVPYSSVKNVLSRGASDAKSQIVKLRHGVYFAVVDE